MVRVVVLACGERGGKGKRRGEWGGDGGGFKRVQEEQKGWKKKGDGMSL